MPTTPLSARRAFDGDRSFKVATGERIDGTLAKDLEELMEGEGNALLHAGTSENLCFLPDRSVDAVITAPPYFDNVAYSELADFFYLWLHLGLRDRYPWLEPENSWWAEELVQNDRLGKTEASAERGNSGCWKRRHPTRCLNPTNEAHSISTNT